MPVPTLADAVASVRVLAVTAGESGFPVGLGCGAVAASPYSPGLLGFEGRAATSELVSSNFAVAASGLVHDDLAGRAGPLTVDRALVAAGRE